MSKRDILSNIGMKGKRSFCAGRSGLTSAFFQAAQAQFVERLGLDEAVNHVVQIGVLDAKLDQAAGKRAEFFVHIFSAATIIVFARPIPR